jgi:hypothetical protein
LPAWSLASVRQPPLQGLLRFESAARSTRFRFARFRGETQARHWQCEDRGIGGPRSGGIATAATTESGLLSATNAITPWRVGLLHCNGISC